MAKFKVGDRVRCLRESHMGTMHAGESGKEYTVYRASGSSIWLEGFLGDPGSDPSRFELVTPATASPIRTVTKREIVDGNSGIFSITANRLQGDCIGVTSDGWLRATELRAAATLFNELADVLDENTPAELRAG